MLGCRGAARPHSLLPSISMDGKAGLFRTIVTDLMLHSLPHLGQGQRGPQRKRGQLRERVCVRGYGQEQPIALTGCQPCHGSSGPRRPEAVGAQPRPVVRHTVLGARAAGRREPSGCLAPHDSVSGREVGSRTRLAGRLSRPSCAAPLASPGSHRHPRQGLRERAGGVPVRLRAVLSARTRHGVPSAALNTSFPQAVAVQGLGKGPLVLSSSEVHLGLRPLRALAPEAASPSAPLSHPPAGGQLILCSRAGRSLQTFWGGQGVGPRGSVRGGRQRPRLLLAQPHCPSPVQGCGHTDAWSCPPTRTSAGLAGPQIPVNHPGPGAGAAPRGPDMPGHVLGSASLRPLPALPRASAEEQRTATSAI